MVCESEYPLCKVGESIWRFVQPEPVYNSALSVKRAHLCQHFCDDRHCSASSCERLVNKSIIYSVCMGSRAVGWCVFTLLFSARLTTGCPLRLLNENVGL